MAWLLQLARLLPDSIAQVQGDAAGLSSIAPAALQPVLGVVDPGRRQGGHIAVHGDTFC